MEEIKVGEWVRTKRGEICKVLGISPEVRDETRLYSHKHYYLDNKKGSLTKFYIANHSKNIIDLIEVGDYVNGYKVISIDINAPNDCKECIELDRNNTYEYQWISRNEIKTILTHEQYEANCYTVERKEEC